MCRLVANTCGGCPGLALRLQSGQPHMLHTPEHHTNDNTEEALRMLSLAAFFAFVIQLQAWSNFAPP